MKETKSPTPHDGWVMSHNESIAKVRKLFDAKDSQIQEMALMMKETARLLEGFNPDSCQPYVYRALSSVLQDYLRKHDLPSFPMQDDCR